MIRLSRVLALGAALVFMLALDANPDSTGIAGSANQFLPTVADTLRPATWHYLGPFSVGPREGITGIADTPEDLVAADREPGSNQTPAAPARRYPSMLAQGGYVEWRSTALDSSGSVSLKFDNVLWDSLASVYGAAGVLNVAYAYTEFETPRVARALVIAERVGVFYLNGKPYPGDPYGSNGVRIPVVLKQGLNQAVLKLSGYGEPSFKFELIPAAAPLILLDDYTTPDLIRGEAGRFWIGVTILNTLDTRVKGATLTIGDGVKTRLTEVPLANLTALCACKLPVQLEILAPAEGDKLVVPLEIAYDGGISRDSLALRVRQPGQSFKRTFISRIDGSCQYYAVLPPSDYDPGEEYALILTLHGASVRAEGQADAYKPKPWAFIVAPTNRRPYGFDWQDWGRLDALEVLGQAEATYPIDPDRVYLTGHSMGGHGVWHVGLAHPDLFAAMAPGAGWTSFDLYIPWFLQKSSIFAEPAQLGPRNMSLREDQPLNFVENARNLPIFIFQGGADDNVPPVHPRMFVTRLEELGYEYKYKEIPGKGHWWSIDSLGTSCVDDPDLMKYLEGRRRDACPREVVFKTSDLAKSSRAYWVEILGQMQEFRDSKIWAGIAEDSTRRGALRAGCVLDVRTDNVREFAIYPCGPMLQPAALHVRVDGNQWLIDARDRSSITFALRGGKFRLGENHANRLFKSAATYGPIKQAYFSPFVLVYGTRSGAAVTEVLLHQARLEAMQWWMRGNGFAQILPDSETTADIIGSCNLILFGGPSENSISQMIERRLPIRLADGHFYAGGRRIDGDALAAEFVYPNPLNTQKLVVVHEGIGLEGLKLSTFFGALSSASGLPDYLVFDASVRTKGWAGMKAAGFFDADWHFSK